MAEVVFDYERKRITLDQWSARTTWLRSSSRGEGMPSALLGVRRNVHLLVQAEDDPDSVWVELWAGEPEESDGLAVVVDSEGLQGLARIALCGCGNRGCGNVGLQLAAMVPSPHLPALVDSLRELPDLAGLLGRARPGMACSSWDCQPSSEM